MTIQSQVSSVTYSGNGSTTLFAYPFRITTADSLLVWLVNETTGVITPQVYNVDYSVSEVNELTGGNINFTTPPPDGYDVFIARLNQKYIQLMTFLPNGRFSLDSLEQVLDRLALQDQQLDLKHQSTVRFPYNEEDKNPELPIDKTRASKIFTFDDDGNVSLSNYTYTYFRDQIDRLNEYIDTGTELSFPLDLGFVEDTVITHTYDLGGLT